nr:MAG: ORF1 [TTV-like mini virus]
MPAYWRANRYRKYQQRRRRRPYWISRWRARRPFQRRRYRRKRNSYRKVKRRFRLKKAKKITVKQFQPYTIQKCKIIGYKCLFQGSTKNLPVNYIQYIYSTVPPYWPGGGGWSIMVFSLTSLFEDWEHLENIWTKSNLGLPLVKYRGCILKLYQSYDTDYVAVYDRCWPMIDTELTHPNAAPSRMLQNKHKIVIPSRKTNPRKKPYKKIFIRPPSQMQTQWYFQRDICKLPLFMLTTTAVDLLYPFANPHAMSNNITLYSLNPFTFQNLNFTDYGTTGYSPKTINNTSYYLYASTINKEGTLKKKDIKTFIPLINTKDYQPGTPYNQNYEDTPKNWGNPFHYHYLTDDTQNETYYIYISQSTSATFKQNVSNEDTETSISVTKVTGPMLYSLRYNPAKDKGDTNKIYLVSTSTQDKTITPPANENLIIEGLPLFILLWSWTDWVIKAKITPDINKYRTLIIDTKMFDTELPHYILLDQDFIHGKDPYTPEHTDGTIVLPNAYNRKNWHPKVLFQQQSIKQIAISGPAVHRDTNHKYIQAYCKYKFLFTWGGCPKQLPKPFEPCLQPKWTTANNIPGRLEITNPQHDPKTELYDWDWEEDYVTAEAVERVKCYTKTDSKTLSTANRNLPKTITKTSKKEKTPEKEEQEILQQLLQLRQQRQLLQLQLNSYLP